MIVEKFLFSVISSGDKEVLFKVKEEFVPPKERPYLEFVKDFYSKHNKLPDLDTVEDKFNIQLLDNTETTDYWYSEIVDKYQEYVIEQAIINSAKNKTKALDIMQQAIVDYNVDVGGKIYDYSDGKRRIYDYDKRKGTGGITYLSTGSTDLDSFSLGFKKADLWTIGGREGLGKAEPLSNKIYTHNKGLITFGELELNDEVYGSDGKPQKVIGIYPQGKRPVYEVSFADGTFVFCDEEHLWSCENRYDREKNRGFKVKTTKQLFNEISHNSKLYYRIPNTPTIQFKSKDLKIKPYLMGALLGDGCTTGSDTTLTSGDEEVLNRARKEWDFISEVKLSRVNDAPTIRLRKIDKVMRMYGLKGCNSYTKFIPMDYLNSSVEDRIELLRGLMDTDGYVPENNANAEFSVRSKELAIGIMTLVRSLGGVATLNTKQVLNKPVFMVRISFYEDNFINCFYLKRKADNFIPKSKVSNGGKVIRSIKYSHEEECQCISVSNEDRLYLTGVDGIVTHNTWYILRMAEWLDQYLIDRRINKSILFVSGEMDAGEIEERLDAIRCEISYAKLSKGDLSPGEERKYKRYLQGFESNIRIVDSFDSIKDVEYYMGIYRPALTFIDGSHLLSSSYDWTEIAKVTASMKRITRNNKIPIVNTTHLKAERGKSAQGGDIDDFAYTKGYTRDSDIVGVMYASDMMELEYKVGIDWVKVRRGSRTQLIYQNDYDKCTTEVVESKVGSQIASAKIGGGGGKSKGDDTQLEY